MPVATAFRPLLPELLNRIDDSIVERSRAASSPVSIVTSLGLVAAIRPDLPGAVAARLRGLLPSPLECIVPYSDACTPPTLPADIRAVFRGDCCVIPSFFLPFCVYFDCCLCISVVLLMCNENW